jgi:hypothetical protein
VELLLLEMRKLAAQHPAYDWAPALLVIQRAEAPERSYEGLTGLLEMLVCQRRTLTVDAAEATLGGITAVYNNILVAKSAVAPMNTSTLVAFNCSVYNLVQTLRANLKDTDADEMSLGSVAIEAHQALDQSVASLHLRLCSAEELLQVTLENMLTPWKSLTQTLKQQD